MKVLDAETEPVLDTIDQARTRALEVLKSKEYETSRRQLYLDQFAEIRDGAERCNNVSQLRSFANKADALKLRLLDDMAAMDEEITRKKAIEEAKTGTPQSMAAEHPVEYKVRTTRNLSIKKVAGTSYWRLESPEDVERYVSELRSALLEHMDENTIINVEL